MPNQSIYFIYASTSGNVEFVMDSIADSWRKHDLKIQLMRAEQTSIDLIKDNTFFVFGTSTWEHGVLNPFFKKLAKEMKTVDCSSKVAAFIGLGDTRYEKVLFCGGMLKLLELWQAQGGQVVGVPMKINGEPFDQLEKILPLADQILEEYQPLLEDTK